ncbi:hypothetical protein WJX74_009755 [Apatococcus lobatus]|uniref:JmjC domain-containing protein n=1 Tax=Apatococcus lobatus TaxID=904363 RepID=A0AAW1RW25_9CHLO
MPNTRSSRQRDKVDYQEASDDDAEATASCRGIDYRALSARVLGADLPKAPCLSAGELTADQLRANGFRQPIMVPQVPGQAPAYEALGIELPAEPFTPAHIAEAIGRDHRLHTIDVATQSSGPNLTLGEWTEYMAQPAAERKQLLNVVSLQLSNTGLEAEVVAPEAVRAIDLVDRAWPPNSGPRPEVLLYALMSPAGCFTDFHVDFGGSAVWYHVVSGSKVFIMYPPSDANLAAFEEWSSTEHQAKIWEMEGRLGVQPKFRFPLFKPLLWNTAAFYQSLVHKIVASDFCNGWWRVSQWELDGLPMLLDLLKSWLRPQGGKASGAPKTVCNPKGLLEGLTADLDAIRIHQSKQQQSGASAGPNSTSLLPVFDDRPVNGGTLMTNGLQPSGIAGRSGQDAANTAGDLGPADVTRQPSLQEDINGLLEGLEVGDILDLGLPDAPESAWAASNLADLPLRDPFAELSTMEPQTGTSQLDDASLHPGLAQRPAGARSDKQQLATPQKQVRALDEDEPLSDSDVDDDAPRQKVSSARKGRARMPLRRLTKRPAREPAVVTSPQAAGPPPDDPKVQAFKPRQQGKGPPPDQRNQGPAGIKLAKEVDRLQTLLRREQALQARAAGGQMKLHDGGTRLAARVATLQASLQSHVSQLRALLPGCTASTKQPPNDSGPASTNGCTQAVPVLPVSEPEPKPETPVRMNPDSKLPLKIGSGGLRHDPQRDQRAPRASGNGNIKPDAPASKEANGHRAPSNLGHASSGQDSCSRQHADQGRGLSERTSHVNISSERGGHGRSSSGAWDRQPLRRDRSSSLEHSHRRPPRNSPVLRDKYGRRIERHRDERDRRDEEGRDRRSPPPARYTSNRDRWGHGQSRDQGRDWKRRRFDDAPVPPDRRAEERAARWQAELEEMQRAEAAAAAEASQLWTLNIAGINPGPYNVPELRAMLTEGRLQPSTMVHEEEEGVSMSLSMLLGQAAHAAVPAQDEQLPDPPPPPPPPLLSGRLPSQDVDMEVDMTGDGTPDTNGTASHSAQPPPPPPYDYGQPMPPHNSIHGGSHHAPGDCIPHQPQQQQYHPQQHWQAPQQPWVRPPRGTRPPRDWQAPAEPAPAATAAAPWLQQQNQWQPVAPPQPAQPQRPDQFLHNHHIQSQPQQQQEQQLGNSYAGGTPAGQVGSLGLPVPDGSAAGLQQIPAGHLQPAQGPQLQVDDNGWIRPAKRAHISQSTQPRPQPSPAPHSATERAASDQLPMPHQGHAAPLPASHADSQIPQGDQAVQPDNDGWIRPAPRNHLHSAQPVAASLQDAPVSSTPGQHDPATQRHLPQGQHCWQQSAYASGANVSTISPSGHEVQQQQQQQEDGHSAAGPTGDRWIRPPAKASKPSLALDFEDPESIMVTAATWSPEYEGQGWAGAAQDLVHQHLLEEYSWKEAIDMSTRSVPAANDKPPDAAPSQGLNVPPSQQQHDGPTMNGQVLEDSAKAVAKAEADGWIRPSTRRPRVAADTPSALKQPPAGPPESLKPHVPKRHERHDITDDGWVRPRKMTVQTQGVSVGEIKDCGEQIKQEVAASPRQQMPSVPSADQPGSFTMHASDASDGWIRPPRKPKHEELRMPNASSSQPPPAAGMHATKQAGPGNATKIPMSQLSGKFQPVSFALPQQEKPAGLSDPSVRSAFTSAADPEIVEDANPGVVAASPAPQPASGTARSNEGGIRPKLQPERLHQDGTVRRSAATNMGQLHAPQSSLPNVEVADQGIGSEGVQHQAQHGHAPNDKPEHGFSSRRPAADDFNNMGDASRHVPGKAPPTDDVAGPPAPHYSAPKTEENGHSAAPPFNLPISFQPGQLESLAAWIQSAAVAQNVTPVTDAAAPAPAVPDSSSPESSASLHANQSSNTAAGKVNAPVSMSNVAVALPSVHAQQRSLDGSHLLLPPPQPPLPPAGSDAKPHCKLDEVRTYEAEGKSSDTWAQPASAASGKPAAPSQTAQPSVPQTRAQAATEKSRAAHAHASSMQNQAPEQLPEPMQLLAPGLPQQANAKPILTWHEPSSAPPAAIQRSSAEHQEAPTGPLIASPSMCPHRHHSPLPDLGRVIGSSRAHTLMLIFIFPSSTTAGSSSSTLVSPTLALPGMARIKAGSMLPLLMGKIPSNKLWPQLVGGPIKGPDLVEAGPTRVQLQLALGLKVSSPKGHVQDRGAMLGNGTFCNLASPMGIHDT